MTNTNRIVLRHPEGVSTVEADDLTLLEAFYKWILSSQRFSDFSEKNGEMIFNFDATSHVSMCNIKWRKICGK